MMKNLLLTILMCGIGYSLYAQDLHFSQYEYAPLNLNAAHTGLFDGNHRVVANYRSQWFDVPVAYRTVSMTFDTRILPLTLEKDKWGIGLTFNHDQAGDSKLSLLNIHLSTAYTKQITKHFYVGAGVQVGFSNRRFHLSELTFNDQFNGDVYDPNIQSWDQAKLAGNNNISYLDVNTGLNFRYEKDRRMWVNLGGGLFHLTQPNQSFLGGNIPLPMRWNVMLNASLKLSERFDLLPVAWVQRQQDFQEIVFGTAFKYYLNPNPGRETAIQIGAMYRWEDAFIARIGFEYQRFHFALSYDINISGFEAATRNNGGYELSVQYIWATVPPLPEVKTCPVF